MQTEYELDVFISYSSRDKAWVRGELLEGIEKAGLKAFIDYRDFTRGAPLNKSLGQIRRFQFIMSQHIDPRHKETRALLRVVGPGVVLVGLIFTIIGIGSFFSSFGTFGPPRHFWCAFVGLPLLGLGGGICKFAFMGAVSRYMADEVAPVGKDVVNYMAEGTKGAVRDVAAAVSEGLRAGASSNQVRVVRCDKCNADNEAPANFCKACGAPFTKSKSCPSCGELNDPDARFCDHCGKAVA